MTVLAYTQEHRRLAVRTALGDDALLLTGFQGREEISSPFDFRLDLMSPTRGIDGRRLLGTPVAFFVADADDEPRWFHGIIRRFGSLGRNDRLSLYRAEVVPWTWLLSKRSDNRVFQFQTTAEIVADVFRRAGHHDFRFDIVGELPVREYCVQYGESDLDFVSRLLEDDGLFYFFEHEQGKHTLVIADHRGAFPTSKERSVRMGSTLSGLQRSDELLGWEHTHQLYSGDWGLRDFSFEAPSPAGISMLSSQCPGSLHHPTIASLSRYEYPGGYTDRHLGDHRTRLRLDAEEATGELVSVRSICRTFSPGVRFRIEDHHDEHEIGREYVVRRVEHKAELPGAYLSGADADRIDYENHVEAFPVEVHFRPPCRTARPVMRGPQTATVVGPEGQEIYIDKHARVKVQFHWDREGRFDENSSCWVRVSQLWAGKGFGWLCHPRIGQEVIVDFLDGDPDRPIVVGRVYNGDHMPPISMAGKDVKAEDSKRRAAQREERSSKKKASPRPAAAPGGAERQGTVAPAIATAGGEESPEGRRAVLEEPAMPESVAHANMMTSLRSNSLGGGGGCNEITMDDTGSGEGMFFKAQKDEVHTVGNNRVDQVGNDESSTVGNNRTRTVGVDESVSVGHNQTVDVGQNIHIKAGSTITLEVGLSKLTMNKAGVISLTGTMVTVAGMANVNVAAPITNIAGAVMLNLGAPMVMTQGMLVRTGASSSYIVNAGEIEMKADGENRIKGAPIKLNG